VYEIKSAPRLNDTLYGFPRSLLPDRAIDLLARFYLDLDALGRIEVGTGEPLIDEHTLFAMLSEFVGNQSAERLVRHLRALPENAFRPAYQVGPLATEVSWFELADHIVIYDTSPGATFHQLDLPAEPDSHDIVTAVRACFPSLEEELLQPYELPPRIKRLLEQEGALELVLRRIDRQLGWWAALMAVLLIPPAIVAVSETLGGTGIQRSENAWPLSMYLLAAAVGGWTLTIVGSAILAPLD